MLQKKLNITKICTYSAKSFVETKNKKNFSASCFALKVDGRTLDFTKTTQTKQKNSKKNINSVPNVCYSIVSQNFIFFYFVWVTDA